VLLHTRRLTLIAATLEHVRTEQESPDHLSTLLDAHVSSDWPTGEYDRDAMEFFRARLEEGGKEVEGWYGWYAVKKADADGPRALVGAGGYLGPPDSEGAVAIGYSVLPEWRGRGYASELVQALLERAFSHQQVRRVTASTTESNRASIGVLLRCGFLSVGVSQKDGTLQFERGRTTRRTMNSVGIPTGYAIRHALPGDVPALPDVEEQAGRLFDTYDGDLGLTDEIFSHITSIETFEKARHAGHLWVAVGPTREIVGFALVRDLGGCAHLDELDVLPSHGQRGLGAGLLAAVCDWAHEARYPAVTLSTFRDVPWNGPFYQRRGFHVVEPSTLSSEHVELVASERRRGLRTDLRVVMANPIGT